MYARHFGLAQEPFSIAPDPRYLFMSERHREALAHLVYGLRGGGGFVLLTGEIGTGKTTTCRCMLEQVPDTCNVAYIFNPKLTAIELLLAICDEFGVTVPREAGRPPTVKECIDPLNAFLLEQHAQGRSNVLVIDEAQNLSPEVLEQLRLLTNLETSDRKLLQIVLIGQPELRAMLARPELEQLAQRVIARYHLDALTPAETAQYVAHRLSVAGLQGGVPFDNAALERIHKLSRGIPRRINLLCDRALLGAYAGGKEKVDRAIVDKAAEEVFGGPEDTAPPTRLSRNSVAIGVLAGAALVAAAVSLWTAMSGAERKRESDPLAGVVLPPAAPAASAPARDAPPAPPAAPVPLAAAPSELPDLLRRWPHANGPALADAARLWKAPTPFDCATARAQQLECFDGKSADLAFLRALDRPVVLTLRDLARNPSYVVLRELRADVALVEAQGASWLVPLKLLPGMWEGEFTTLWRTPPGYERKLMEGDSGPAVEWLGERLARWSGQDASGARPRFDSAMRRQLQAFQRSRGLAADGRAGPLTLMHLNRATGTDEPRLVAG